MRCACRRAGQLCVGCDCSLYGWENAWDKNGRSEENDADGGRRVAEGIEVDNLDCPGDSDTERDDGAASDYHDNARSAYHDSEDE
jgi:hypothetical protein